MSVDVATETRPNRWVDAGRTHRTCSTCGETKPMSDFSMANKRTGRRQSECRPCMSLQGAEWRRNNPSSHLFSREYGRAAVNKSRGKDPVAALVRSAKHRAKQRGIEFTLTATDVVIPEYCPVLGIKIVPHIGTGRHPTHEEKDRCPSIDRIENSKGYTPDNIVVVSVRANRLKSDASTDEIRKVAEFYGGLSR
jgi:hypothetical protein